MSGYLSAALPPCLSPSRPPISTTTIHRLSTFLHLTPTQNVLHRIFSSDGVSGVSQEFFLFSQFSSVHFGVSGRAGGRRCIVAPRTAVAFFSRDIYPIYYAIRAEALFRHALYLFTCVLTYVIPGDVGPGTESHLFITCLFRLCVCIDLKAVGFLSLYLSIYLFF